jgi:two-component system sensor histidine kinase KdpD
LTALLVCASVAAATLPLHDLLDLANIVMLHLLAVVLVASCLGRGPAVIGAVVSVALFDLAHVPPRWSFAVGNVQYLVTLMVMLVVAVTIGQLAWWLQHRAAQAQAQAARTHALFDLARTLAGAMSVEQAEAALANFAQHTLQADLWLLLPSDRTGLALRVPEHAARQVGQTDGLSSDLLQVAQGVHRQWPGRSVRQSDGEGRSVFLWPLSGATRSRGVLVLRPQGGQITRLSWLHPDADDLMAAMATLVATSLERLHFVEVAHRTQMEMRDERLRNSILSALSHDLRTPLTALVGSAEALQLLPLQLPETARGLVDSLRDQALRLHHMVSNLLDMARLQHQRSGEGGQVLLRREWQPVDEVIGASIALLGHALDAHPVHVQLPPGLPLVHIDAVLMERVFGNLLENAAKYGEPGPIAVGVQVEGPQLRVSVRNAGTGFPAHKLQHVFDVFERGESESATPGMGLGLSICRAIVEAHGGRIRADNPPDGGARVAFTLPLGTPPEVTWPDAEPQA